MRLEDARRVMAAAEKKAAEIGQPMNIAVADEGGDLVAHVRMDNAWIGSIDIAQKKAFTDNRQLMQAILHDKIQIAKAVNVHVISLAEAPKGYQDFDKGAAKKFVIDPHGTLSK